MFASQLTGKQMPWKYKSGITIVMFDYGVSLSDFCFLCLQEQKKWNPKQVSLA